MNTSTKREAALKLLSTTGIWKSNYAPPGVKLLWRLGIDCPPPHLARFWSVFFVCGLFFGLSLGLSMWVVALTSGIYALSWIPLGAGVAGLSFGFLMATYYAIGRKKHRLPLWKDIRASGET